MPERAGLSVDGNGALPFEIPGIVTDLGCAAGQFMHPQEEGT
jgi:hypothetical protein